jgi:oligopeptide/dipeptide ABC transporter ATP-binding protein
LPDPGAPFLSVRDLRTEYRTAEGTIAAVRDVSFDLHRGEKLGLVGESGCGKSALAMSLLGLVPSPGRVTGGEIWLNGRDVAALGERELDDVRGREISLVFQDPTTSLDPVMTVGSQIGEAIRRHQPRLGKSDVRQRVLKLMREVEIPRAESRFDDYPWEYSGGMRQRIMIAIALANEPDVVIADEPTTALDVTTQAQVLGLMQQLVAERGAAVILITHNIALVAEFCDTVQVMYAGRLVERAAVRDIFSRPVHPYTEALLQSSPRLGRALKGPLPSIPGTPPQLDRLPPGCSFAPRCPVGSDIELCRTTAPPPNRLARAGGPSLVECHFANERLSPRPAAREASR